MIVGLRVNDKLVEEQEFMADVDDTVDLNDLLLQPVKVQASSGL
jgi:hypothetical protein